MWACKDRIWTGKRFVCHSQVDWESYFKVTLRFVVKSCVVFFYIDKFGLDIFGFLLIHDSV